MSKNFNIKYNIRQIAFNMEGIFNNQSQEVTLLNRIKSIYFLYFDHKKRLESYSNEFNIFMNEYLEKNKIVLREVENEVIPDESHQESKTVNANQIEKQENSTLYKKIYRNISLQCHPDKTQDKNKIETFNIINHYYKENDCIAMSLIAINKGMMEKSNLKIMEDDINEKVEQLYSKINDMKLTYAWIFKFSSETEKIELIKKIIANINCEELQEEICEEKIEPEIKTEFPQLFDYIEEVLEDDLRRDLIELEYEIDNLSFKLDKLYSITFEKNIEQINNYKSELSKLITTLDSYDLYNF